MTKNQIASFSGFCYAVFMKKIIILLIIISGVSGVTHALSFAPNTIFLEAKTKESCDQLGGTFTEWYGEVYCTKVGEESMVTSPKPTTVFTWTYNEPFIRVGSSGSQVTALQECLARLGNNPSSNIDGKFGPITRKAVMEFQASKGLKIDGIIGNQTGPVYEKACGGAVGLNKCEIDTGYSTDEYLDGWKKSFKNENNLSESEFNEYILITETKLFPIGDTCELSVRYNVKKDWIDTSFHDQMYLGVLGVITPDNLPRESDINVKGREGVTRINLHDDIVFKDMEMVIDFFLKEYRLNRPDVPFITSIKTQTFWEYEDNYSGGTFEGTPGEMYVRIDGVNSLKENQACYRGLVFLNTKEVSIHYDWCEQS